MLAEYREKAPKIVAAIRAQGPEASRQTWDWVFERIVCALALICEWRFEDAYQLYAEVCMQLEAHFLADSPERPATNRSARVTAAHATIVHANTRGDAS